MGIRMGNNAGALIAGTTGGGAEDLLHTLSLGRKAVIRKVVWYNPLAVNVNILLGTYTTAGVFAQLLPTIIAIPTLSGSMEEEELSYVEFLLDTSAAAAGTTGDIYVQDAGAGGLIISLEIEEI